MTFAKIRQENLYHYIQDNYATRKEFADKIGKSTSQVSMWFMKSNGRRDIGDKLARELEEKLELPCGWLDKTHQIVTDKLISNLKNEGFTVNENKENFSIEGFNVSPRFRLNRASESFLLELISSPYSNTKRINAVNSCNTYHFHKNCPENAIVLLSEEDLMIDASKFLIGTINERLNRAKSGTPFQLSSFTDSKLSPEKHFLTNNLMLQFKELINNLSREKQLKDATFAAKALLSSNGFNVIETPKAENSGRLVVFNKYSITQPSLIVILPNCTNTFYIDIATEKRFGIFPIFPDEKCQEILFLKTKEIVDIVPLTKAHIKRWYHDDYITLFETQI